MSKRLCIIPARGGSKRIPGKNIKLFLGKPIIAYSIQTALHSGLFHEVMVSTEDEEIAAVAKKYGAGIPFARSEETADDFASTVDVIIETIEKYRKRGKSFSSFCCLYATAPFVTAGRLQEALSIFEKNEFDCVFPVIPFGFPIQRALRVDDEGRIMMIQPEYQTARSQDLEPAYHDSGQFYWGRPETVSSQGKLWTDNTGCIILSEMESQDIDTEEDWQVAEYKYAYRRHDEAQK